VKTGSSCSDCWNGSCTL